MKAPRWYQQECHDAIFEYFEQENGNPLCVVPTGAGKSLILSMFIKTVFSSWPDSRVIVVAHVKELLTQNQAELVGIWPDAPTSFWSASIGQKKHSRIIFAGIASIYKNAAQMGPTDLLIIDEAHLVPSKGFGMYRRFIDEMRKYNPHLKVIGLTATPYRLDHGLLVDGSHIFTHHCYEVSLRGLIEDGYLSPLRPKKPDGQIDMAGVHIKNHEFDAGEMEAAAMKVVDEAVNEVIRLGQGRKSWMVFCSGIGHAEAVTGKLMARGISARLVTGETPKADRETAVTDFAAGRYTALVNVGVFTTGFNARCVDLIAMLRSTLSAGLYVQIAGRGMRLSPETGKKDCLFLDFGGNVERHGPIDQVRVRKPGEKEGVAPVKVCPECEALCAISVRECPDCGYQFPIDDTPKHDAKAAVKTLLSWEKVRDIRTLEIDRVTYVPHVGKSGKKSMRVVYWSGLMSVSEYICLEHDGFAKQKARQWWSARTSVTAPDTVSEGIAKSASLEKPESLVVDFTNKYPEILKHNMPPPKINTATLQAMAQMKARRIGVDKVKEIIRRHGADMLSRVSPDKYESLYKELAA